MKEKLKYWNYAEMYDVQNQFVNYNSDGMVSNIDFEGMKNIKNHRNFNPHYLDILALNITIKRNFYNREVIAIAQMEKILTGHFDY